MSDQVSITPWPVSDRFRRVILVGGTFDPPHSAHVRLVDSLRASSYRDAAIVFIPAAVSPFKAGRVGTDPKLRSRMIALACANVRDSGVWTDEIDRARFGEPSYTIDTLRRVKFVAPDVEPVFVIGSDQAAAFHRWREPRGIRQLARVIVLAREPFANAGSLRAALEESGFWSDEEVNEWIASIADVPTDRLSSTEVRERIMNHGVDAITPGDLDPAVADFIREHRLYARS